MPTNFESHPFESSHCMQRWQTVQGCQKVYEERHYLEKVIERDNLNNTK